MKALNGRLRLGSLALLTAGSLLAAGATAASAQNPFTTLDHTTNARVDFSSAQRGSPIEAGSQVNVSGQGFKAGQKVDLVYGTTKLNTTDIVADAEGKISATIAIPAGAVSGTYPIVVLVEEPYYAAVTKLKVSPTVPLAGQDKYTVKTVGVVRGLYQSAFSPKNNTLFVTAAIGRPPVKDSELLKLNADTLAVVSRISPAAAPAREGGPPPAADDDGRPGLYAVYGVGVDDSKDTVWVTNTRQNTVSVYKQSDLSLIKQFAPGTVPHARDIAVDQKLGKVYSTAVGSTELVVIDTNTLEVAKPVTLQSKVRGEDFSAGSLSLNADAHKLYVVSLSTNEVAVINTQTDQVENVFAVPGATGAIGVSHDPQTGRIFVASQGSDNLVVLDGTTGAVIADTPVGAGALNVVFDPVKRLAYVANRGAGTITVTDPDGRIVANLGPSPLANHVSLGKNGVIYAVDKSAGVNGVETDEIQRIAPRK